jgi:hypothetical protein
MVARRSGWLLLVLGTAAIALPPAGPAASDSQSSIAEAQAAAPSAISVTVYRDPYRASGSIDLDRLGGFALVTETRAVHLRQGESWLRFEGVADGIEPESAIVTGLDDGIIEKNRDAAVLSPSALAAAAIGKAVVLTRTSPKTGLVQRVPGTVLSDAQGGVIFSSEQGIEALRCSGLPETLSFDGAGGLRPHPTLSVKARSQRELSATVTLSYLARGFDWAADYTATLSPDGRSIDLGGWVTLANGNGVSLREAQTQVVAGRVNRVSGAVDPIDIGGPILAKCWPRGSTSDSVPPMRLQRAALREANLIAFAQTEALPAAMPAAAPMVAQTVRQEALGDLKLYRVPERTTVAARQSKQVRLLDRESIPVRTLYVADLESSAGETHLYASKVLRAKNDTAHHLGMPLPAGRVQVFGLRGAERLLEHQSNLRDLAVDEELEISMGPSADVNVAATRSGSSHRVDISNARSAPIQFELRLHLPEGTRIAASGRKLQSMNGRPLFRLSVPRGATATVDYRTQGPK